jgi:hypothetical protein
VLTGAGLPMASVVGWASSTVTAWPEGRWWLLMSRRGVVRQWGPHGGGGRAVGRPEATLDGEARGRCNCGASEAHRSGAA